MHCEEYFEIKIYNYLRSEYFMKVAFGYPGAFIQGSDTINFLFKFFIEDQGEDLTQFKITFCQPIFFNQNVQICYLNQEFELIDSKSKLVAFGSRC